MPALEELITKVGRLKTEVNRKILDAVEKSVLQTTEDNFNVGGYTNDYGFEPWAPRHGVDRRTGDFGIVEDLLDYPIGDRSGRMKKITTRKTSRSLKASSNTPYAEAFQKGRAYFGKEHWTPKAALVSDRFVARPFLGFGKKNEDEVNEDIQKLIEQSL